MRNPFLLSVFLKFTDPFHRNMATSLLKTQHIREGVILSKAIAQHTP